ncbi:hypothetical protein ACQJBY_036418 [Aegilops geniculata]
MWPLEDYLPVLLGLVKEGTNLRLSLFGLAKRTRSFKATGLAGFMPTHSMISLPNLKLYMHWCMNVDNLIAVGTGKQSAVLIVAYIFRKTSNFSVKIRQVASCIIGYENCLLYIGNCFCFLEILTIASY